MTIAQVQLVRPPLLRRQRRGAALAGLVSGAALALESALLGTYLADSGFAIADGEHVLAGADILVAALAALLLVAAWLLPLLILRRHGVLRAGWVAVTGGVLAVMVWLLLSVVAGVVAVGVAYLTIIVVWSDSLFGAVLVVAVVVVGLLVIGVAIPVFLGMAKAFQSRSTRVPASLDAPGHPPAPPVVRV